MRELSLLIAARHFDARYSWNAHDKKVIEAGVSPESIKELANKRCRTSRAPAVIIGRIFRQIATGKYTQ